MSVLAQKPPDLVHNLIPVNIKPFYNALPETERMLITENLSKIYSSTGVMKLYHFIDMISKRVEIPSQTRQFFKEVLKNIEPEINREIAISRNTVLNEKVEDTERGRAYHILAYLNWLNTCKEYLEIDIARINFKLKIEGSITEQGKILTVMIINHVITALPDYLRELGLSEAQVDRYRKRLSQFKVAFVSEEEWKRRKYPEGAEALLKMKSETLYVRFIDDAQQLLDLKPLVRRQGTITHEMLHYLTGGYSNNSNSMSLHEALTETFKQLAIFRELGLPILSDIEEHLQETIPSRRYTINNLIPFANLSYRKLVTNDEFQELFAVIGRLEWQRAYFSRDFTEIKTAVNNYLSNVPNGFDYLFNDESFEDIGSIALVLTKKSDTDPLNWTEKFDKAKKPYKVEK